MKRPSASNPPFTFPASQKEDAVGCGRGEACSSVGESSTRQIFFGFFGCFCCKLRMTQDSLELPWHSEFLPGFSHLRLLPVGTNHKITCSLKELPASCIQERCSTKYACLVPGHVGLQNACTQALFDPLALCLEGSIQGT